MEVLTNFNQLWSEHWGLPPLPPLGPSLTSICAAFGSKEYLTQNCLFTVVHFGLVAWLNFPKSKVPLLS